MKDTDKDNIKKYLDNSLFLDVGKVIHSVVGTGVRFDVADKLNGGLPPVGLINKTEEVIREVTFNLKGAYELARRR